ncbi:MAG: ATP-binding cassette domain-containing protein [Desulfobulbaceae bacterium]|nr:ATP-binding cassette domain-containing protein [Desulfobulbaceae bacterium]
MNLVSVAVAYRVRAGFMKQKTVWALKDVSFNVYEGETLGIIGRNGAGKSTLLQVLSGIITPDKGTISTVKKNFNPMLLSLQTGFVGALTGRENIILSGLFYGIEPQRMQKMLDKVVEFSGLGPFIDQAVNTYSTGMRARLGFAVAIHSDPDAILIDEVLGVGDIDFKEKSTVAMKEKISSDKTVIIVTHNPKTLMELCDRVVLIENGKSTMEGTAEEVLACYDTRKTTPDCSQSA